MNGPQIVCVGCGEPTTGINAICDKCLTPPGESGPPVERCPPIERCIHCEHGSKPNKWGLHLNERGGYIGKCSRPSIEDKHEQI